MFGKIENCYGPCIEEDLETILTQHPTYKKKYEILDETLFSISYPKEYQQLIYQDIIQTISVWLDKTYEGKKPYVLEEDVLFSDNFMISVHNDAIFLLIYIGCDPLESAKITQELQKQFGDIEIHIDYADTLAETALN